MFAIDVVFARVSSSGLSVDRCVKVIFSFSFLLLMFVDCIHVVYSKVPPLIPL
ncbi:hypothetical protein K474DRAFT_1656475 [Panus rudis PR-1116 ss-1]|nr:hypothetical protein K474DRAFT_1656475 [Panus rudis PR-1116 ss-1]